MVAERQYASLEELDFPIGEGLDNPDRLEWLGSWSRDCFRVELWNTQESDGRGYQLLAYRLCFLDEQRVAACGEFGGDEGFDANAARVWEIVFCGEDFSPGAAEGDEDLVLSNLLGFLGVRPEIDVGDDYFVNYTDRQREFATEHGEELSIWSADLEGE